MVELGWTRKKIYEIDRRSIYKTYQAKKRGMIQHKQLFGYEFSIELRWAKSRHSFFSTRIIDLFSRQAFWMARNECK